MNGRRRCCYDCYLRTREIRSHIIEAIGGLLRVPLIDGNRTHRYFGRRCHVEGAEVLEKIARGVPVEIRTVTRELAYGNDRRAAKYEKDVTSL